MAEKILKSIKFPGLDDIYKIPGVEGSVQPDYNQNDSTAADYIKNRPFYTGDLMETELVDVIAAMAESGIDWDVQEFDGTNSLYMGFYDGTLEVGKEYAITINGNQYTATSTLENMGTDAICFGDFDAYFALMTGSGDGSDFNYLVVYSETDGAGVIYKGTEAPTECKIYLREQELVKLDPKYLPEGGVGYVTTEAGTETFDIVKITNDLLENDNGYGGLDALPPEEAPTEALWIDGYLETYELPLPFKLVAGQEYKVSINNISYTSTAVVRTERIEEDGEVFEFEHLCIGDIDEALSGNFADLRFVIRYEEFDGGVALITLINAEAFDLADVPAEINISCPAQIEVVHKIDSKFLPDDIGGNGTSNVQSDWNENNPEADGYIKNRPFYEELVAKEVIFEEDLYIQPGTQISDSMVFTEGETYFVTFNDVTYQCVAWSVAIDVQDYTIYLGNGAAIGIDDKDNGEPFLLESSASYGCNLYLPEEMGFSLKIETTEAVIHKIDSKFLPDDIGSVPDWNQNDETAPDYIKNRPFYDEIVDLETCIFSDTVFVNVENDTIASYPIYCSQPLVEGKTYNVTFNGELYECIARNDYSNICIGNGNIWGTEGTGNNEPFCISYASDGHFLHTNGGKHHVRITTVLPRQRSVKINNKYLPPIFNGSWNELTDRPFGDTIFCEWDSNKEYESITIENANEPENPEIYYKVSNNVFEQEELFGAIVQTESIVDDNLLTEEEIINEDNFDEFVDGYCLFDFAVIIAKGNDSDFSRGIWVRYFDDIVRLKIYGETKKLDKKFLEPISWNELPDKPFELEQKFEWDSEVEYEEIITDEEYGYSMIKISSNIPSGKERFVGGRLYAEIDGEHFERVLDESDIDSFPDSDNVYYVASNFMVVKSDETSLDGLTVTKGVWFFPDSDEPYTKVVIATVPKKIDPSVLHDPYYYEKGEPVYEGSLTTKAWKDGDLSIYSYINFDIKPDITYIVEIDGKDYICKSKKAFNGYYYLGNLYMDVTRSFVDNDNGSLDGADMYYKAISGGTLIDTGEPFCIADIVNDVPAQTEKTFNTEVAGTYYIRIYENEVHKIHEGYIPNNFVRKEEIYHSEPMVIYYGYNRNVAHNEIVEGDLKFIQVESNFAMPKAPSIEFLVGKFLYTPDIPIGCIEIKPSYFTVKDDYHSLSDLLFVVTASSAEINIGVENSSVVTLPQGMWLCFPKDYTPISFKIIDEPKFLSSAIIPDEIARVKNTISIPLTAQVGQTIVVKTIDENGRPTSWECVDLPTGSGLPPVTAEDEGKILRVVNGVPTWVSLPYAEEAEF